jgi:hypothetical protein
MAPVRHLGPAVSAGDRADPKAATLRAEGFGANVLARSHDEETR